MVYMSKLFLSLTLAVTAAVFCSAQVPSGPSARKQYRAAPLSRPGESLRTFEDALPIQPIQATSPGAAAQVPRRATTAALAVRVTDNSGSWLSGVRVSAQGATPRDGSTGDDGTVRFINLRPGSYRLRFAREGFITLERDVTLRAGETLSVDANLSAAPPPPKAEPEPAPVAAAPASPPLPPPLPPPGEPKLIPIPTFLERNFIGREARKDSVLGCTPTGTATLHQLREAWAPHTHNEEDEWVYVVAGEGTLRIGTLDQRLQAGTLSLIPHSREHTIQPQGRNPLIVVSILSGQPCKTQ